MVLHFVFAIVTFANRRVIDNELVRSARFQNDIVIEIPMKNDWFVEVFQLTGFTTHGSTREFQQSCCVHEYGEGRSLIAKQTVISDVTRRYFLPKISTDHLQASFTTSSNISLQDKRQSVTKPEVKLPNHSASNPLIFVAASKGSNINA